MVKPKLIYISNSAEIGESYSLYELKSLYKYVKDIICIYLLME